MVIDYVATHNIYDFKFIVSYLQALPIINPIILMDIMTAGLPYHNNIMPQDYGIRTQELGSYEISVFHCMHMHAHWHYTYRLILWALFLLSMHGSFHHTMTQTGGGHH